MEYLTDEDYRIARQNGIPKWNAYQRFYYHGWTKKRAITQPLKDGTKMKVYREKCAEIGLSYSTFSKRVKRGIEPEKALYPAHKSTKLSAEQLAIAEQNGISGNTAKIRVYQYKWDVERAITEPIHKQFRKKGAKKI